MSDTITGIQWDEEAGDWYVTIDFNQFPYASREGISDFVGGYKTVTEAAEMLLKVLADACQAEIRASKPALREFQDAADAAQARLEAHRFRVMMVQTKTEEAGRTLQSTLPPKSKPTPRKVSREVRRFRFECQRRGLNLKARSLMLAALSHFFGLQVLDGRDLSAPQWEAAALAVRRGKLGW